MTVRPIVIHGDPVLHNPTTVVDTPLDTPEIQQLIKDMYETMDAARGVGLAANQIGVGLRIFVYGCPDVDGPDGSDDEGCLSVPGEGFPTGRADWARVTGLDENGEEISIEGYGFFARCLQHEVGHLDGYLYTDVLTGRYKRAAKKAIKANGWTTPGLTWMPGEDRDPFGHDER